MAQEYILRNDITQEHRARMLNLKKYFPFFKLTEVSFDTFKQGQYENLDMGFIVMAVLRFFIEENNFKEKEVTYPEYVEFMQQCIKRDFGYELTLDEYKEIADYVFDKIKNDGKPFEFGYYDPVDKKHKVSRMRLIESSIRDNTVWYSISADAIEFYLDTKEIKEESRISVQQLLLEKMIRAQNFKGGTEVIWRINDEVERLMLKKKDITSLFAVDVFAGFEAYQEFVDTGMKWFDDEQKLFVKNKELIEAALSRMENEPAQKTDKYLSIIDEIYELDHQLKVAMNRHGELLRACMDMQKMTDDIIHKNKLSRLKNHCDYRRMLEQMMKSKNTSPMVMMVKAMLKPKTIKRFNIESIDQCLSYRVNKKEEAEVITKQEQTEIIFPDEQEDERISHNYGFFAKNILGKLKNEESFLLSQIHDEWKARFGENADRIIKNGDYYSFLVHLCQKKEYIFGEAKKEDDSFLDAILRKELSENDYALVDGFTIEPVRDKKINITDKIQIGEILFTRV